MELKQSIQSQYLASLAMLKECIEKCPDTVWVHPLPKTKFWHVAYHCLFYVHFYLSESEETFQPYNKEWQKYSDLGDYKEVVNLPAQFSQQEALEYLDFVETEVIRLVEAVDLNGPSGFYWLPFDKLETHLYSIRHTMQHVGELGTQLVLFAGIEISWVGRPKIN